MKLTEDEYMEHVDSNDGCCLNCEEWTTGGVEPDAEHYPCAYCGEEEVYGAEQLMIMGEIQLVSERAS